MSPQASWMLENEVVPRLRVLIPQAVSQVGHEDYEELVQDSTLMAARMLVSAELRGKKVTAGNIAHYTVLHARSGRRSYAAGSSDAMNPIVRMRNGEPESMEYLVKEDELGGDPFLLADVFSNDSEDPAVKAARKLDWDQFVAGLDDRFKAILIAMVEGESMRGVAVRFNRSPSTIQLNRNQLVAEIREFFGHEILKDIVSTPQWRNNLEAQRQTAACREERKAH